MELGEQYDQFLEDLGGGLDLSAGIFGIPQAAEYTNISRSTILSRIINASKFEMRKQSFKVSRRFFIRAEAVLKMQHGKKLNLHKSTVKPLISGVKMTTTSEIARAAAPFTNKALCTLRWIVPSFLGRENIVKYNSCLFVPMRFVTLKLFKKLITPHSGRRGVEW